MRAAHEAWYSMDRDGVADVLRRNRVNDQPTVRESDAMFLGRVLLQHADRIDDAGIAFLARELDAAEVAASRPSGSLDALARDLVLRWRAVVAHGDIGDVHVQLAIGCDAGLSGDRECRRSLTLHDAANGLRCFVSASTEAIAVYRAPQAARTTDECARLLRMIEAWDVSALRVLHEIDEYGWSAAPRRQFAGRLSA